HHVTRRPGERQQYAWPGRYTGSGRFAFSIENPRSAFNETWWNVMKLPLPIPANAGRKRKGAQKRTGTDVPVLSTVIQPDLFQVCFKCIHVSTSVHELPLHQPDEHCRHLRPGGRRLRHDLAVAAAHQPGSVTEATAPRAHAGMRAASLY